MSTPPARILAFEAYDGGSHRAVRASITRHSRHRWHWVTLPARAWNWRMRLGAAQLIDVAGAALDEPWDAIVTTSLTGAADLRAFLPPTLRTRPLVLIMHENQVAYPTDVRPDHPAAFDQHYAITNLNSILASDLVLWNSAWNLESFITGIVDLLRHAPSPGLGDVDARVRGRSAIWWPPVEAPTTAVDLDRALHNPMRVVWPHRWEHDKGPEELLDVMRRHTVSHNLRWTILGHRFERTPEVFATIEREFADRIDHIGTAAPRDDYCAHLARCDWVLSTARHEFFGIAVVEAMRAGCLPWLPPRLSYPELVPSAFHGLSPEAPPPVPGMVRRAIIEHLRAADAPTSVARLDAHLDAPCVGAVR